MQAIIPPATGRGGLDVDDPFPMSPARPTAVSHPFPLTGRSGSKERSKSAGSATTARLAGNRPIIYRMDR